MRYRLVQTRNSPNWYIQWFEQGHSRRSSTGTADVGEAQGILAAFVLVRGEDPPDRLTVSQALDWYWTTYAERELAKPANADLAIRNLKPFFGATPAIDCTISKQQAYADHKTAHGYGRESLRRDLSVLSAALKRAEKHNKLTRAPPALTLQPAPPRDRWLTRDEAARLLWSLRGPRSRHVLLFARLALYTGARTGAILDLTWSRVDFSAGLIHYPLPGVNQTSKRRTVSPMGPVLRRALRHAKRRARSNHVIEWAGQRVDRIAKAFIAHAQAVGLDDVTPHVLRHSFATWAVRRGASIYMVGKALGQTVASTTERYAKHTPDDIAKVMDLVRRK